MSNSPTAKFKHWLQTEKKCSPKVAGDVVSRVRKVAKCAAVAEDAPFTTARAAQTLKRMLDSGLRVVSVSTASQSPYVTAVNKLIEFGRTHKP